MKARARTAVTTLFLLAVAAGAVAVAWFGVHLRGDAERRREEKTRRVFEGLDAAKVREVRISGKDGEVRLVRAGDGWKIAAPVEADADPDAVRRLLDRLVTLERRATSAPAGTRDLAAYGLAAPRARLEVTLEGGRTERLALGDDNGFDGAMFVQPGGGEVDVVAGDARAALDPGLLALRDKRVLRLADEKDVVRVRVQAPRLSYALARDGEAWRLEAPRADRADDATAGRIASALRWLSATEVVDAPKADGAYGLDRPRYQIAVTGRDGAERRLVAGAAPGAAEPAPLWVRVVGALRLYQVPAASLSALDVELTALRDRRVLRFEREKVVSVRIETAGGPFEVKKAAPGAMGQEGWRLAAPRDAPAQAWRMSALLSTLSTLDAAGFFDETGRQAGAAGLLPPRERFVLRGGDGKELAALEVGRDEGDRVLVRGSQSPRIYSLERSRLAGVPRTLADLEEAPAPLPATR